MKQLLLGAVLLSLTISAKATIFYDWVPGTGFGGVGFMEFADQAPPTDFASKPILDFSFQFDPAGSVFTSADIAVVTSPTAQAGVLTSLFIVEGALAFTVLDFTAPSVFCFNVIEIGTCAGSTSVIAFYEGGWVLRDGVAPVSEPGVLTLFLVGLLGLGYARKGAAAKLNLHRSA